MFMKLDKPEQALGLIFKLIGNNQENITQMFKVITECNNFKSYYILCLIYIDLMYIKEFSAEQKDILNKIAGSDATAISINEIHDIFNFKSTEIRTALKKLELNNYIESIYLTEKVKFYKLTDKGYSVIK